MSNIALWSTDRSTARQDDEVSPVGLRVRRIIETRIITNVLRPGERLSESELAAKLGVSRQPVREALIRLSEASLVLVLPQRGTVVTKISVARAQSARFLRLAVENAVAREAAMRADAAAVAVMRALIDDQAAAVRSGDHGRFLALDDALHRAFAASASHEDAWRLLHNVKLHMDRVRYLSQPDATPAPRLLQQHIAIVDAIEARDPAAAAAMMTRHLSELLTSLPRLIEMMPDYFDDGVVSRRS
jgi:DNA-binding GntR family transcriptional regulator